MTGGDPRSADVRRDAEEKRIPRLPRSRLRREPPFAAVSRDVDPLHGGGDAELPRKIRYELRLFGGFLAPEHMVEMGHVQREVEILRKRMENGEEADRIRPTRYGN